MISFSQASSLPIRSSKIPYNHRRQTLIVTAAFRPRPRQHSRPRRRHRLSDPNNPNPNPTSDEEENTINLSINLDPISQILIAPIKSRLNLFLNQSIQTFYDLKTSVQIDDSYHVRFTCQRASILYLRNLVVFGVVMVVVARVLGKMGLGLGFGDKKMVMVTRRDRSLGGREVVVGISERREKEKLGGFDLERREKVRRKKEVEKLPEWWVEVGSRNAVLDGDEGLKKEADRLVAAILDDRLGGKDYKDDDILQLRQICKISGARVSFGTENARDSFYRASVNFIFNICSRVMQPAATVQIDGEDVKQFICGLAENIGLEDVRAAKIIRASVAARTRSCFLQSWAFEVQSKRFEALQELSKICQIFQIFPPEEYSAEMEMVAGGLKKTIGLEQRKQLLSLFTEVCGSKCQNIAAEALDLVSINGYEGSDDGSLSEKFQII